MVHSSSTPQLTIHQLKDHTFLKLKHLLQKALIRLRLRPLRLQIIRKTMGLIQKRLLENTLLPHAIVFNVVNHWQIMNFAHVVAQILPGFRRYATCVFIAEHKALWQEETPMLLGHRHRKVLRYVRHVLQRLK